MINIIRHWRPTFLIGHSKPAEQVWSDIPGGNFIPLYLSLSVSPIHTEQSPLSCLSCVGVTFQTIPVITILAPSAVLGWRGEDVRVPWA